MNSTHKIVVTMLQQLVTECTGWYWLHSLVHLLQQLVAECTGWYWLHSLVHLLQQLVTECTDWYWLHSLVHLLQPTGYKSTNRVLATQSLLYSASPNWLHTQKKKSWLNVAQQPSKFIGDPSLPVFLCRLQKFTVYSELPVMESWYWTELPNIIWLQRILRPVSGLGDMTGI